MITEATCGEKREHPQHPLLPTFSTRAQALIYWHRPPTAFFSLRIAPPSHGSTWGSKPLLGSQTRQVVLVDCLVGWLVGFEFVLGWLDGFESVGLFWVDWWDGWF